MKNRINSNNKPHFISRAGSLIKDNTSIAKDGMAFYLDTLWKLPGAYAAGRDQMKSEKLSRSRIKSFEDVYAIKSKIDESMVQINSIKEWVYLAQEGTWSMEVKKTIDGFGLTAGELEKKAELSRFDYQYFADSFLSCHKDALSAFFRGDGDKGNTDPKEAKITDSLMQMGLLGDRVEETFARACDLERDVEILVDTKLSHSKINKPKRLFGMAASKDGHWFAGMGDTIKRSVLILKLAVLGVYYVARAFVFMIRYFILLPASFVEGLLGGLKKKNGKERA